MADQTVEQGAREAIQRFYAAADRFMTGDAAPFKALWSQRDDVTAFGGWGGYEVGWDQVGGRWDWAAQQMSGGTVTRKNLATVITAEMAYIVDATSVRIRVDGSDREEKTWQNRQTHIFRLEDGQWRLVHRHVSRLEPREVRERG